MRDSELDKVGGGDPFRKFKVNHLSQTARIRKVTFLNCHKLQKLKIISILWQKRLFPQNSGRGCYGKLPHGSSVTNG